MIFDFFLHKLGIGNGFYENVAFLTEYFTFLQNSGRIKNSKALITFFHKVMFSILVASNTLDSNEKISNFTEKLGLNFSDVKSMKAYMNMIQNDIITLEEAANKKKKSIQSAL